MNSLLSVLTAAALLLDPGGETRGQGFQDGRTAGVKLEHSRIIISGDGAKTGKSDGYQIKRPCWYEPRAGAEDMLKSQADVRDYWLREYPDATPEDHEKFLKQFKDKVGQKGHWWTPAYDSQHSQGEACWSELETFVWVPPGTTPPSGITLAELAEIARAALTVPEPKIQLNPDAKSYVNLPTWVWLGDMGDPTRSVTAAIPGVMSATVTATLDEIKIKSGTTADRGEVRTQCGTSGKPYVKGGEFTCGVRYLRASIDQPRKVYELTVTTVWPVEAADNVVPFQFAPVQVSAQRDVPVGEVQSNVKP